MFTRPLVPWPVAPTVERAYSCLFQREGRRGTAPEAAFVHQALFYLGTIFKSGRLTLPKHHGTLTTLGNALLP